MQYPHQILESRVRALKAEVNRERESLPAKGLAFFAVILSLFSLGLSVDFNSLGFILPALFIALYVTVKAIGAWGLRSNLRDSEEALKQITD